MSREPLSRLRVKRPGGPTITFDINTASDARGAIDFLKNARTGEDVRRGGVKGKAAADTPVRRAQLEQKRSAWSFAAAKIREREPSISNRAIAPRIVKAVKPEYRASEGTVRRYLGSLAP